MLFDILSLYYDIMDVGQAASTTQHTLESWTGNRLVTKFHYHYTVQSGVCCPRRTAANTIKIQPHTTFVQQNTQVKHEKKFKVKGVKAASAFYRTHN